MTEVVRLRHRDTNAEKLGYYGFSWATLFLGPFPALFRGDILAFVCVSFILAFLGMATYGFGLFVGLVVWAFMDNNRSTRRLLNRGYVFFDTPEKNDEAEIALDVFNSKIVFGTRSSESL